MTERYFGKNGAEVKKSRFVKLLPLKAEAKVNVEPPIDESPSVKGLPSVDELPPVNGLKGLSPLKVQLQIKSIQHRRHTSCIF
jgi:hypothetical protein